MRVQFLLDEGDEYGYYDWSCGTITECAGKAYTVRFDGDQYYDLR